jgi:hypothetical protein
LVVPVKAICLPFVVRVPLVLVKLPVTLRSPPAAEDRVKVPPLMSTLFAVIEFDDEPDDRVPFAITKFPVIVQAPPAPAVRVILWPVLFIVKSYTLIAPNVALVKVKGWVYELRLKGFVDEPFAVLLTVKYRTSPLEFDVTALPL